MSAYPDRYLYLSNAFSLSMIPEGGIMDIQPISLRAVQVLTGAVVHNPFEGSVVSDHIFTSVVGHTDTAALFGAMLGRQVETNRVSITLNPDDILIVGQYNGPRLPEGTTVLPERATVKWYLVAHIDYDRVADRVGVKD